MLLPPRCPVSGDMVDTHGAISPEIWKGLSFISNPFCEKCGFPFEFGEGHHDTQCMACLKYPPPYNRVRSALIYNDTSRDIILGFKHGDKTHSVKIFIPWLIRIAKDMWGEADVLIPVPLHKTRLITRRYNQAGIIAYELSKASGIAHYPMALQRIRATPSQGHLKTNERVKNVKKAFRVRKGQENHIKDKNIILIDDVYTTGATIKECAKTLYQAGANRVDVITLARVTKD